MCSDAVYVFHKKLRAPNKLVAISGIRLQLLMSQRYCNKSGVKTSVENDAHPELPVCLLRPLLSQTTLLSFALRGKQEHG